MHALARLDAVVTASLLGGAAPGARLPRGVAAGAARISPLAASDHRLRENAWSRMTIAYLAFVLVVVGWPVTTVVYEVHPAAAMVVPPQPPAPQPCWERAGPGLASRSLLLPRSRCCW